MIDSIFGDLDDLTQKLERHQSKIAGVHHHFERDPLDPIPGQPIQLFLTTGGDIPFDAARCSYSTEKDGLADKHKICVELVPLKLEWDDISWSLVRTWVAHLPAQQVGTLVRYRLEAHRVDNDEWIGADGGQEYSLWVDHDPIPEWARSAIVYQIFPDRYSPGIGKAWNKVNGLSDIYGGTLRGIIEKLDYIQALGFNTIWINPFFPTTSHHGYNASDYYSVEPRLGTRADLDELISSAHSRDIRLILDFVANHWSKDHFTFKEAQKDPNSQYRDWYTWRSWPGDYECYFNVHELPKINLSNTIARGYMLDIARYWLKAGFDGYRLDFAYGPTHDFWVEFRRACRDVKPDCWIFGEIIQPADVLRSYTGIMDGTLDFFLNRAIRDTFARRKMSLSAFEAFLSSHEKYFPKETLQPSFLDNHDQTRFLYLAEDDKSKLKLAALVQYTLAGPPIVYAGTETGLSQERPMFQNGHNIFEECRLPMNWETADASLQEYYQQLNHIRSRYTILQTGQRKVIHLDLTSGTYGYQRFDRTGTIIIMVNIAESPQQVEIGVTGFEKAVDILFGNKLIVKNGRMEIYLAPKSGAFITRN
jgi:cyclomaltodextrinase / maltogenic alpha-amylase / neopullulanase